MHDSLGDRIKSQYEDRTRYSLPRRTYTIIRIDGKSFHSWTRGFDRPYDLTLMGWMNYAAQQCVKQIQGCKFAYVQSDEASFLLTDFDDIKTDAWFDGNIQKIVSVSASLFTAYFNLYAGERPNPEFARGPATFDSRTFIIPDRNEVANYFVWRFKDCKRNSISSLAQFHFSHKQLLNKSQIEMLDMIYEACPDGAWDKQNEGFKNGRFITKDEVKPCEFRTFEDWITKVPILG